MTERIRAELRRTGGFTGREVHVEADTATLPPAQAARLAQLAAVLDLTGPRGTGAGPALHGADLMRYDLTVERGAQRWQGTFQDPGIPAEVRPLLQFLIAEGRTT